MKKVKPVLGPLFTSGAGATDTSPPSARAPIDARASTASEIPRRSVEETSTLSTLEHRWTPKPEVAVVRSQPGASTGGQARWVQNRRQLFWTDVRSQVRPTAEVRELREDLRRS